MQSSDTILITGAGGLAGSNLVAHLQAQGFRNIVAARSQECDLTDLAATLRYFDKHKATHVFHMAGHVFGIMGNMKNQGAAYFNNNQINTNVVEACRASGVKKIVAMGTVAMYPDPLPSNPLREDTIWQGAPHSSERGYAHAKRGMLAMLETYQASYGLAYAFALSTNLYGPQDRFNIETGHVIPSLVRKFREAQVSGGKVTVWGDGSGERDFLYIKDAAQALHLIMDKVDGLINLATGTVHTIRDAVEILARHAGMAPDRIVWDAGKPNGQIKRAYDVSRLTQTGFRCAYDLKRGLAETFDWYAANEATARKQ